MREKTISMTRTYSELIKLPTLKERFEYCSLGARVGNSTFGWERYLNQQFYTSEEWRSARRKVIIRDGACELAHPDYLIGGKVIIHHLNPLTEDDILGKTDGLLNPENLVCVSHKVHNAIHYGSEDLLPQDYIERTPGDTVPWKKGENDESQCKNSLQFYVRDARSGKSVKFSI